MAVKWLRRSWLLIVNLMDVLVKCGLWNTSVNRTLMELWDGFHGLEPRFVEPNANDASSWQTLPGAKSGPEMWHIR